MPERMRAVLVECLVPGYISRLEEVKSIMETIGYEIVDLVTQKRDDYDPAVCIGKGKLDEIKRIVQEKGAKVVTFANTLSGGQVLRIQKRIRDAQILDRNLIILELFEKRAMTREAKLQIKLARLLYTYGWGRESVRMKGIEKEQMGPGGPGGYPFQVYEKDVRRRVSKLRAELRRTRRHKEMLRVRREKLGFPVVALAGYTQSGKTTFFNSVVSETKQIGLGPFTTLSTTARFLGLSERGLILVDSIGFVEDMHPLILDAFNTTLAEISSANLILLFIDLSEEDASINRKASASKEILCRVAPSTDLIVCANKLDLVKNRSDVERRLNTIRMIFDKQLILPISARTGENIDLLFEIIKKSISEGSRKDSIILGLHFKSV